MLNDFRTLENGNILKVVNMDKKLLFKHKVLSSGTYSPLKRRLVKVVEYNPKQGAF